MAALPARVVAAAALAFWWRLGSAQADMRGCQPPDANFLSRVDLKKDNELIPNDAISGTQQLRPYQSGTEAIYRCDPGFVLVGDTVRVCKENQWSGAAPHCYLNVAERSSLVVNYSQLADGNTTTFKFLLDLFSSEEDSLFIRLYFPTRVKQVRVLGDKKIQGASKSHGSHTGLVEFIAFEHEKGELQEVDAISLSLPDLENSLRQPHGNKVYEIQIIANSTGLSWRQCLDGVGPNFNQTQYNTWAVGDWCYHLMETRPRNQQHAETRCNELGEKGILYRPATGIDSLTIDMVSAAQRLRPHNTRSKTSVWIHGQEDSQNNKEGSSGIPKSPRCRVLSPDNSTFNWIDCGKKHPYICQRAPRVCGRFPREAGLYYTLPERVGQLRGKTINVTCGDPGRTTGQIRCLAPHWTSPDFCRPKLHGGTRTPRQKPPGGTVGAILGGTFGGAIVLAVLTVAVIRNRNGRQQRQRQKQLVPQLDDSSEFLGLTPNPIYGDSGNEDEHLYSEVSIPEAIYEECSYEAPLQRSSPEPPPPPATRPSVGSLAVPPASPDLDYEVFPMETEAPQPQHLHTAEVNVYATAAATPAPPVQTDPDYEPIPVEPQMSSLGTGGPTPAASMMAPAVPDNRRPPTLEYAVPLVGGKPPTDRQRNSSFTARPTDGGPEVPHVSVGEEEAEYVLPYRASSVDPARRSIPDVAMVAMGVGAAGPAQHTTGGNGPDT